jgi:hypothetical protein
MMKVYFTGAHSVGKTTLARYVSEKHKLPMVTEVARAVLAEKELQLDSLRVDLNVADSYQSEVFYRQIAEEKKCADFVADRSAIDALTYSAQHTRVIAKLVADTMFKDYVESLKDHNSIIFYVRPSKATLKNDGVREQLTWDGIVSIDAMVKLLLELFSIRYFQINTDNMQERIKFVDAVLSIQ